MIRPHVSEVVKRAVRQRCGFGCILCGHPIYDYDHAMPWAEVREHEESNLILLCGTHHDEKGKGLIREEVLSDAMARPYNVVRGISSPYEFGFGGFREAQMRVGGNRFVGSEWLIPFVIDNEAPVSFSQTEDGLALSIVLRGEDNEPMLRVERNELIYKASSWDVEFTGRTLRVRTAPRRVALEVRFSPNESSLEVTRADFHVNGVHVEVMREKITVNKREKTMQLSANWFSNIVAFSVGDASNFPRALFRFQIERN